MDQDDSASGNSPPPLRPSRHHRPSNRDEDTRPERPRWRPWFPFLSRDNSDDEREPPTITEAQIRELQNQVHDAHTRIRLLESETQDAHNAAQEAWAKLRVEEEANRRLHKAARSIESERDTMSASIQKQEAQIRQVQALAFGSIGGDSWAAGDDGTVRADLEGLQARIKSWAKKHAVDNMSDAVKGLSPDEHAAFIQWLGEVVRLRPGAGNPIQHLESGSMNKRSPAMCLQGLLAQHIYAAIISRPFFALGDPGEEVMNKVYSGIHQVNVSESHLWRAKTLRLLSDLDLSPLLHQAGTLSTRLWSRKTILRIQGLAQLRHERFAARSELLRAHPLHRLYDDDERCDGWAVGVVTHPAVWGYGSGDGREYG
ncbi:hypothetical protein C8A05DRAFT_38489, partial [Staphylotrichum tortipilum]